MDRANNPNAECMAAREQESEFSNHTATEHLAQAARTMARKQLAVSSDSPFNLLEGTSPEHLERAQILRQETDEIKKQLDLVRSRLNDFNEAKQSSSSNVSPPSDQSPEVAAQAVDKCEERKHFEPNQQATSSDSQFHPANRRCNRDGSWNNEPTADQARTRPLTGRADCPNCECDKRRKSICDTCASFQQSIVRPSAESCARRPSFLTGEQQQTIESSAAEQTGTTTTSQIACDERPIRPAKQITNDLNRGQQFQNQPVHVGREVVPNQLFSIGKSLNDKRVQLAEAVDELQLMMDKVKKRGERLDQERKVAQLYKEQWRFGPTIGGGSGVENGQSVGRRRANYQSRLDPQLTRDSNSLMGFQHIEPSIKLRQFGSSSLNVRQFSRTPQPKPRLSKMGKMPSLAHQTAMATRLAKSKEHPDHHHARSKSLDSLHQVDKIVLTARHANPATKPRVINHKEDEGKTSAGPQSSLQANFDAESRDPEEEIEEELDDGQLSAESRDVEDDDGRTGEDDRNRPNGRQLSAASNKSEQSRKTSWVPVFGETEIKTVDRRQPSRKTLVLDGQRRSLEQRPPGSILRQRGASNLSRAAAMKHRSYSAISPSSRNGYGGSVMSEATKKLKFANDLLEREKRDSLSKNQLIVFNKLRPPPAHPARLRSETQSSFRSGPSQINRSIKDRRTPTAANSRDLISDANQEIERLQAKIDKQKSVLSQLSEQAGSCPCAHHQLTRPLSSSSRQTRSKSVASNSSRSADTNKLDMFPHEAKHQLVLHLKEQLNRTKSRLAKMLQEERIKHQELEKRVNSSLRRQTDLRAENEILRQSLNRCIDTCLRDICSTFESLSESIVYSTFPNGFEQFAERSQGHHANGEVLDVAQLLENNQHLRQLRAHIETIESQRRSLFDELSNEKLKSKQLELQLIEGKLERDQLLEANRRLEGKLLNCNTEPHNGPTHNRTKPQTSTLREQLEMDANTNSASEILDANQPQSQADISDKTTNGSDEHCTSTSSTTLDSIDIYRHYIQSMTPDLEAIRRERRMILDEFDSIKKMLANMNE